jgi:hypothetical protein
MREPTRLSRIVDKVPVIDNAIRNLDILKLPDEERFILRDTQHSFGEDRVQSQNIWLDRDEMIALRDRVDQMLNGKVLPAAAKARRTA